MNNIHISIITLNKNDHLNFLKLLKVLQYKKISFCVEWLILDGSDQNIYKKNKEIIRKELLLKRFSNKSYKFKQTEYKWNISMHELREKHFQWNIYYF